jgi:DNA-binding protein YbaB
VFGTDGMDFSEVLRNSRERMAKAGEVRERMAGLSGLAETSDGRIKVVSTSADPLAELHIDPRALRMGSDELAAAIRQTARRAREDLDRQAEEVTTEAYGEDGNPMDVLKDTDAMKQNISDMQNAFEKAGSDAQTMVDQLRRSLGISDPGTPR